MSVDVRIVHEGEAVDAEQMDFKTTAHCVEMLDVEDGTKIEVDHRIKSVFRLRDKKAEDGTPIYVCAGQVIIKKIPAEHVAAEIESGR